MKLSIIVPVYNVEKYLAACIDSILAQSFTEWELVLVDDGSKDGSGQICDGYADKDVRINAVHQVNAGAAEARNRGILEAKGEYVTFVDSDDVIRPNFLSNFTYDESLDFEIQGFTQNFIGHEQDNISIMPAVTQIADIKEIYSESELNKLSRGPVCKLFKRSVIIDNNVTYPQGIQFGEDAIFVKRYLTHCNGKGRSIAAADYIYNHFPSQVSLTSKRHPGQMMYDVALMDYNLFMQLEQNWRGINAEVKKDFIYIRTLEFYNSICSFMTEKGQTYSTCHAFLKQAKLGMFQLVKDIPNIPPTYQIIRISLAFPSCLAVLVLKTIFTIKKPAI